METTTQKLDRLAELDMQISSHQQSVKERRNLLDAEKDVLIQSIMTDEQKKQLEEINAEFADKYEMLEDEYEISQIQDEAISLTEEIRNETLITKETVRGEKSSYMCVYTPEKSEDVVSVNTEALIGMAVLMPKLKQIYTVDTVTTPAKTSIRRK